VIGEKLNNYRITGPLGEGGMGIVYRAEHDVIGRQAAIKVMRRELAANTEAVARFINEARAANAIRHRHIIEIFDAGVLQDGTPFLTMELLEGETLATRLHRLGRLPVGQALEFAIQSTSALVATHTRGIVHRDLKPDNIFIVPDDVDGAGEMVKILDFGIAKLHPTMGGMVQPRAGTLIGTPIYMSPEQCRGSEGIDHRTDIYSLGLILYEALNGALPFSADSPGDVFSFHLRDTAPPLRNLHVDVPEVVDTIIARTMAKLPEERFVNAAELLIALRQAAQQVASAAPLPVAPKASPSQSAMPARTKFLTPPVTRNTTTLSVGAGEKTTQKRQLTSTAVGPSRRVLIGAGAGVAAAVAVLVGALVVRAGRQAEQEGGAPGPVPEPRAAVPAQDPAPVPTPDAAPAPAAVAVPSETPPPSAEREANDRPARPAVTRPVRPARTIKPAKPPPNWKRDVRKL